MNDRTDGELSHSRTEILAFPLLNRGLRLEVAKILQVQAFVFVVQFYGSLLSSLYDGINIIIDEQSVNNRLPWFIAGNQVCKGTHSSVELMIFSAPWVIISRSSSLFAAGDRESLDTTKNWEETVSTFRILLPSLLDD